MKKIIIITSQSWSEWIEDWGFDNGEKIKKINDEGIITDANDEILILLNGEENFYADLENIINKESNTAKFYLIYHGNQRDWEEIHSKYLESKITPDLYYSSIGDKIIYNDLIQPLAKAIKTANQEDFKNYFSKLLKYCEEDLSESSKINELLHLFLPLDIDMQALSELLKNNDKSKAKEYLEQMNKESNEYYKRINEGGNQRLREFESQLSNKNVMENYEKRVSPLLKKLTEVENIDENIFDEKVNNGQFSDLIQGFHSWYEDLCKALRSL